MRFGTQEQQQARAARPKKSQKLPPGASYTCLSGGDFDVTPAVNPDAPSSDDEEEDQARVRARARPRAAGSKRARKDSDSDSSADRYSSISDAVDQIIASRSLRSDDENDDHAKEDNQEEKAIESEGSEDEETEGEEVEGKEAEGEEPWAGQGMGLGRRSRRLPKISTKPNTAYPVGCYVVCVYLGKWYVGQVLDKATEPGALGKKYIFVNYMERSENNMLKWPVRQDKLNTHVSDVLFVCSAPTPSFQTSSTRSVTCTLDSKDLAKADRLFSLKDFITSFTGIKFNRRFLFNFFSGGGLLIFFCTDTVPVLFFCFLTVKIGTSTGTGTI